MADHLPEELLADGKPETKLAGIDLTHDNLDRVVQMYGKPKREVKVPNKSPINPAPADGERSATEKLTMKRIFWISASIFSICFLVAGIQVLRANAAYTIRSEERV